MAYDVPAFTSFLDLFTYANTNTGGIFGWMFMISLYAIIFFSMQRYGTEKALMVASFFSASLSVLFVGVGLVSGDTTILYIFGMFIISIVLMRLSRNKVVRI